MDNETVYVNVKSPTLNDKISYFPSDFGLLNAIYGLLYNIFLPIVTLGLLFHGVGLIIYGYKNQKILHVGLSLFIFDFIGVSISCILMYFDIGLFLLSITPIFTWSISIIYSIILIIRNLYIQ